MMSGGSAGLRMMMALPLRGAADLLHRAGGGAGELVDVLARARAGRLARHGGDDLGVATGCTRETAATMGMVAWPPQVTMLTFISCLPMCSFRLTGGTQ